jgi:hypothetical protein
MLRIADLSDVSVVFGIDYEHLGMMSITIIIQKIGARPISMAATEIGSPADIGTAIKMVAGRLKHRATESSQSYGAKIYGIDKTKQQYFK